MTISFNRNALQLDGNPFTDGGEVQYLSKILANQLSISIKGDPIKYYDWARALYKVGEIEVDRADFDFLKNFVSQLEISIIIKAQLLECFVLAPEGKKK